MALVSRKSLGRAKQFGEAAESEVERTQLARLNSLWERATAQIPYYADLAHQGVPRSFRSIAEYVDTVPILTKAMFREDYSRYHHPRPVPDTRRMTGGSTSVPVQIPAWKSEFNATRLDPWIGRSWHGVDPADRLFLYWGHAHLLGTGFRRELNGAMRRIKDRIQNYQRYSCYDMSPPAMAMAVDAIRRSRARFIIGYSSSLDRLARYCRDEGIRLDTLSLKVVIGTAEAFPRPDSADVISEAFGAPVGMEYGAVETGLIAHTVANGGFRVLWWNQLLESSGDDSGPVRVTTLYRRCMPLFRYEVGDVYIPGPASRRTSSGSVLEFSRLSGRLNAQIRLPSGREIHSEAVTHIVRHLKSVSGFQLVVSSDSVRLQITSGADLGSEDVATIKQRAAQIDLEFGGLLEIRRVNTLDQTVAGKTPMVVYRTTQSNDPVVHH